MKEETEGLTPEHTSNIDSRAKTILKEEFPQERPDALKFPEHITGATKLIVSVLMILGLVSVFFAFVALDARPAHCGSGLCLIASAISFGLVLNAFLRK